MRDFLADLAARRQFGMKPGLETIRAACAALGDPQKRVRAIHVAGTNGKGAVCAILDSCLRASGLHVGRYTSPHLVRLNERFFLDGAPIDDETLNRLASSLASHPSSLTFFEVLTAVAFLFYAEAQPDVVVLETGLGGRLDATNICLPILTVITRIGLDHCDWLGSTIEKIAAEKSGIIKPGVPIVLGANTPDVVDVVRRRAEALNAPFYYAPDLAAESEIPDDFSLRGSFNRENAVTALAALKILSQSLIPRPLSLLTPNITWPGRFQHVGRFIVDGAHNPPAARALVAALREEGFSENNRLHLIVGFCGDKDVDETLSLLKPLVASAMAVKTNNPRSLSANALSDRLNALGIPAAPAPTLAAALNAHPSTLNPPPFSLVCGSLFLAGEALIELGAYPWLPERVDPSELLGVPPRNLPC